VWFQTLGADEFDALVRAIGALPTEPARLSLWSWTLNFCTCTCAGRPAEPQRHCAFPPAGLSGRANAHGRCEQLCAVLDLLSNALLLSQAVARSMFRATVPASDVLEVRPFVRSRSDCRATPALRDGHNAQPSPCEPGAAGAVLHLCRGDALELTPEGVAPSAAWHQRCAQVLGGRRDFERIRVLLFRAVGWDMLADMRAVLPPSSLHSVWRKGGGFRPPSHFLGCFVFGCFACGCRATSAAAT
jgi:hypothetical protein